MVVTTTGSGNPQAHHLLVLEGRRELRDGLDHRGMMGIARRVDRDGGSEVWLYPRNLWPPQWLSVAAFSGRRAPSEHERMVARACHCSGTQWLVVVPLLVAHWH